MSKSKGTGQGASLDDLLIAQVTGLIEATAIEAALKDPDLALEYETHFHKLIGVNSTHDWSHRLCLASG